MDSFIDVHTNGDTGAGARTDDWLIESAVGSLQTLRGALLGNRTGVFGRCWLANAIELRGHPRHAERCWFEFFR